MKKMIRYAPILILILCSLSLVPAGTCEFLNGYTVEPVTPDMDTGTPLETVPVDFWQLPPGIILLSLAFSISSFIGFPVELFLFIKLYAYLGCRKVAKTVVLNNETRNLAYHCIQDNPGIYFNALVRKTSIKPGTLRYHLIILKLTEKIAVLDSSGNLRYYENSGMYSGPEKTVLKYIRNETDCRIFRLLLEKTDLTRNDLGEHLGLSVSTISWRMKRLNDEKIIWIKKAGKNVRYEINPEMRQYLEKYLIMSKDAVTGVPERILHRTA
jgi:predicted transcriptional regulator